VDEDDYRSRPDKIIELGRIGKISRAGSRSVHDALPMVNSLFLDHEV
jgi:hypothetical protein